MDKIDKNRRIAPNCAATFAILRGTTESVCRRGHIDVGEAFSLPSASAEVKQLPQTESKGYALRYNFS